MCYYLQLQKYETYSKLFGKMAGIFNGNVNIPDGKWKNYLQRDYIIGSQNFLLTTLSRISFMSVKLREVQLGCYCFPVWLNKT